MRIFTVFTGIRVVLREDILVLGPAQGGLVTTDVAFVTLMSNSSPTPDVDDALWLVFLCTSNVSSVAKPRA